MHTVNRKKISQKKNQHQQMKKKIVKKIYIPLCIVVQCVPKQNMYSAWVPIMQMHDI